MHFSVCTKRKEYNVNFYIYIEEGITRFSFMHSQMRDKKVVPIL